MRRGICVALAAILAVAVGACEREKDDAAADGERAAPRSTGWKVTPGAGTGTIRGFVQFSGQPPAPEVVEAAKCHSGAAELTVAPVSVGKEGRLRDVVVFLKGAPKRQAAGDPPAPAVLDQVNCRYVPAVLTLRTGQTLRVTSSDATLHNVHMMPERNPTENFGFTGAGQTRELSFAEPESFRVRCDVHPWMTADVHVFDHPYYAAVDDSGAFEIKNVPAGRHILVARHGFLGDAEVAVTVEGDQVADVIPAFGNIGAAAD